MPALAPTALDALGREARRHHLLTAAEEIELARSVQAGMASDDLRLQRRGKRARQRMINANLKLVLKNAYSFRKRIAGTVLEIEDLAQAGIIGLNRAVDLFNHEKGYKFSTYSTLWIQQAIRREIELHRTTIKVASDVQTIARRWRYRSPSATGCGLQTVDEFCEEYGYKRGKVEDALFNHARAQCTSLDTRVLEGGNDGCSLSDLIAAPSADTYNELHYSMVLEQLQQNPVTSDAIAALELAQTAKQVEMAELLDVGPKRVFKRLEDMRAVVREHLLNPCDNATSKPEPMPTAAPTSNGHHAIESQIEEALAEVRGEPKPEAQVKPKRTRRSKAEMAANNVKPHQPVLITIVLNGHDVTGTPQSLAALVSAMPARATA